MGSFRSVRSSVGQGSFGSPFSIKGANHGLNRFDRNLRCWLDFVRIMKRIIFILFLLFSPLSYSADYAWNTYSYQTPTFDSPGGACNYFTQTKFRIGYSSLTKSSETTWRCEYSGGGVETIYLVGAGCTSPKIYNSATGVCTAPPPPICTAGKEYVYTRYEGTVKNGVYSESPTSVKVAGSCVVTNEETISCDSFTPDANGNAPVYCKYRVRETGAVAPAASPAATAPTTTPKAEQVPKTNPATGQGCPAGTVSLGIDSTGGSICGGSGTSPTTPTKKEVKQPVTTATNADGSATKTEITTRTNTDGSTTTNTKTTNTGADGKVTTTEGSVTGAKPSSSGGGAGKDNTSDEKKDDFCLKNPNLNICKNSEVTGGGCNGSTDSTACTGDAISCAILRQQKKEYCENTAASPMRTLGEQMLSGNDPLKGTFPTKENARVVNVPSLNQNGFIGGGSCFSDFQFSVSGQSFSIPFSKLCDYLIALRGLVMLLAALASWKLVSKSILG